MRLLPSDEQQARKEKILQAVVHLFIKTGKPVGSSTILEAFHLGLSPATIRNVLADLEQEGFLTHPHTSAGRMPTDKGYRFYVDSIANIQRLAVEEEKHIRQEYGRRMKEIEDIMHSTTKILSAMSQCTAFALPVSPLQERLRRVELISVGTNQVLGVLVSETGVVQNQMISLKNMPDDEVLRSVSRFLTEQLAGITFSEAQHRLVLEIRRFEAQQNREHEVLEAVSRVLFEHVGRHDLYVEGASRILKFPEFQDYETMSAFAHLVDEKETLGNMLSHELNQKGIQVRIGAETAPALKDLSVISTSCEVKGQFMGIIGILGPKRMEYERMMAIVSSVSSMVNQYLDGHSLEFFEGSEDHDGTK